MLSAFYSWRFCVSLQWVKVLAKSLPALITVDTEPFKSPWLSDRHVQQYDAVYPQSVINFGCLWDADLSVTSNHQKGEFDSIKKNLKYVKIEGTLKSRGEYATSPAENRPYEAVTIVDKDGDEIQFHTLSISKRMDESLNFE